MTNNTSPSAVERLEAAFEQSVGINLNAKDTRYLLSLIRNRPGVEEVAEAIMRGCWKSIGPRSAAEEARWMAEEVLSLFTSEGLEGPSNSGDAISASPPAAVEEDFQARVEPWMLACFGPVIPFDKVERNDRFLEESLELTQATGYSRERAHALVDYVFNRPPGEPRQEVGGVMVTLAALCVANGISMRDAAETELARINQPDVMDRIRAKQAAKPTGSALPVATSAPSVTKEEVARVIGSFPTHDDDRGPDNETLIDWLPTQPGEGMSGETFLYKLTDAVLALFAQRPDEAQPLITDGAADVVKGSEAQRPESGERSLDQGGRGINAPLLSQALRGFADWADAVRNGNLPVDRISPKFWLAVAADLRAAADARDASPAPATDEGVEGLPMDTAPRDSTMVWLLVDYEGEDGDHALEDATLAWTIGFNSEADNYETEWKFAGWCWSHDHFTQGHGTPVAWKPIGFDLNAHELRAALASTPSGEK